MIERCSVCGFSGERAVYIPHDCYWVLQRARGVDGGQIEAPPARITVADQKTQTPFEPLPLSSQTDA